jgi:hypothetical protein
MENGSVLSIDTNRYRSRLFVSQADPSSLRFRLRPALRDFAETSRRDKPGWSRGIQPAIIHAPKAGFGFNSKGSARASRAVRRAPASNVFPRTFATRRREPHARARVLPLRHDETPNFYFMHYPPTLKLRWAGELATWRVARLRLCGVKTP